MEEKNSLAVFQDKKIRKIWHNNEWYFSVIDVVEALTGSVDPKDYWYKLKKREEESSKIELSTFCRQLKLQAQDGKLRETDCANTESLFRIIQSIPSPKAEPFKLWLAKIGYERVKEIEDPELAQKRTRELYKLKGYSDAWIEKRVRGIAIRDELTGEWAKRGVQEGNEFAILTAEISKATFGLTPAEYKEVKGLKRENLRDHMDDLELIFSMLGEAATTEITKSKDTKGFEENKKAAKEGGEVAGNAREDLERRSGKKVVTSENYLEQPEKTKRLESKK
ncbi:Bro-N domain-containing protein [Candidatus Woesearchaeota archaeon]|nr:Bro-N domain-containing protein [Candidatus Woesearchaeota archaeon]